MTNFLLTAIQMWLVLITVSTLFNCFLMAKGKGCIWSLSIQDVIDLGYNKAQSIIIYICEWVLNPIYMFLFATFWRK